MNQPVQWQFRAPENLELFGRVKLSSEQLRKLEATYTSTMQALYDAYSTVLNSSALEASLTGKAQLHNLNITTDDNGRINVDEGGVAVAAAGVVTLRNFPELARAMAKVCILAKHQFSLTAPTAKDHSTIQPPPPPISQAERELAQRNEKIDIASDINAFTRSSSNILRECMDGKWSSAALSNLGNMAGFSVIMSGVGNLHNCWKTWHGAEKSLHAAEKIGDTEGRFIANCSKKVAYGRGPWGICQVSSTVLKSASSSSLVTQASHFLTVFGGLIAIFTNLMMIGRVYLYQWSELKEFRSNLQAISGINHSEHAKAVRALTFFKEQLILTEVDEIEITLSTKSTEEKEQARRDKLNEKYARFSRRVGADVAELVAKYTDGIITGLKGSDGRAFGMAMQLIGEVDKGAFKKWVKQITTIAVCVLAIVGIVISLFFTGPAAAVLVPAVLFILNSLGWLLVDSTQVNDKFGDYFWKVSSNWGWGGSTIVDDAKIAAMFTPYQNGNKWNLQQLQNEFRNKSASNMLRVNGRSGQSFDQWLEILGLRGKLDFTKDGVTVNDAEQLKALKWLVATVEHEKILTESAAKARQRGDGVREQQNRPQLPTYVDLYYNPQTDIYAMKTRKRVALVSPSSVSHAADLCGEITFGGVRVWVQDVL